MHPRRRWILAWLPVLLCAGCVSIQPDQARQFGAGVATARQQTLLAFTAVNGLASNAILDFASAQESLSEENFFAALPSDAIGRWERLFGVIETYAGSLAALTDRGATKGFNDAMVELGAQMKQVGEPVSPGLATAFTKLGDLLLRTKAQADARRIALATDPAVAEVFATMAQTIGTTRTDGLRGTAQAHYQQLMGVQQLSFLALPRASPERRAVAQKFAELLARRDAQDAVLAALQQSLLALGSAHHALALGSRADLAAAIARVKQEAADTKALYERFQGVVKEQN